MSRCDENLAVSGTFQTLSWRITHDMYVWIQKKQQIPLHKIMSKKKYISSKQLTFYLSLSMFETVVQVVPLIKKFVKILKIESEKTWEYHDFLLNSPEFFSRKFLNS